MTMTGPTIGTTIVKEVYQNQSKLSQSSSSLILSHSFEFIWSNKVGVMATILVNETFVA
jgi:hypothetical protein